MSLTWLLVCHYLQNKHIYAEKLKMIFNCYCLMGLLVGWKHALRTLFFDLSRQCECVLYRRRANVVAGGVAT